MVMQVDVVVATPKRLAHLVKSHHIKLSAVRFLILDEADKLFELGFVSHIDAVIHACCHPGIVSTCLTGLTQQCLSLLAHVSAPASASSSVCCKV